MSNGDNLADAPEGPADTAEATPNISLRPAFSRRPPRCCSSGGSSTASGSSSPNLWTGIGRARSGCGAAIVGTPDQVLAKLRAYQAEGVAAFILSGYPHVNECDMFARYVLPHIEHAPLVFG